MLSRVNGSACFPADRFRPLRPLDGSPARMVRAGARFLSLAGSVAHTLATGGKRPSRVPIREPSTGYLILPDRRRYFYQRRNRRPLSLA
jgi:hypothetical protein